ncbi:hypothetical protein [Mucilaginibacter pedocola]|uniref:Uncharacterized protein n=1 Tax=Mucilaginibacter pedocola TaxID=1792845 RepID=A0A1S9P7S3_9SPHI|nr:hypothetical protein [Mucilaginibacter pedocola]OOQ56996.1 hypothetical protein BC343_15765 [Mucilaginibacter pedocola]
MKNILPLLFALLSLNAYSQQKKPVKATRPAPPPAVRKLSAAELKLNGLVCDCISKVDIDKLKGTEANKVFEDCVTAHSDLIIKIAAEHKINVADEAAMTGLGVDISKNLLSQNCDAALKLGMKMNDDEQTDAAGTQDFTGTYKRIDDNGFNLLILTDESGNEKQFLWLRQFPGSEKLAAPAEQLAGKKLKINSREIEVYVPKAKGYYTMKEITGLDFL